MRTSFVERVAKVAIRLHEAGIETYLDTGCQVDAAAPTAPKLTSCSAQRRRSRSFCSTVIFIEASGEAPLPDLCFAI